MAFQEVKPHCVAFLQHVQLADARNVAALPGLLKSLEVCIEKQLDQPGNAAASNVISVATASTTGESLTDAQSSSQRSHQLANYVFFPFSQFLQLNNVKTLRATTEHQAVFRDVLRVLATLVRCISLEKAILEQLWTFVALTLGGPLGSKDFQSAWTDDVRRRLILLWQAILEKSASIQEKLQIPGPIVAHTLNTVLLLVEDRTSDRETRLAAMQFLDDLVQRHLEPEDQVPMYLPGIASTLSKVIVAPAMHSSLLVIASQTFGHVVSACLNEERSLRLGLYEGTADAEEQAAPTLESLFASQTPHDGDEEDDHDGKAIKRNSNTNGSKSAKRDTSVEAGRSTAWLRASAAQIHRALLAFLPFLRQNQSATVRNQLSTMACLLLNTCFRSLLPPSRRVLLEELLVATQDDWEEVAEDSKRYVALITGSEGQPVHNGISSLLSEIAIDAVTSIPHTVFKSGLAHELHFQRQMNLAMAALVQQNSLRAADVRVERWSLNLLQAVQLLPIAQSKADAPDVTAPWHRSGSAHALLDGVNTSWKQITSSTPLDQMPSDGLPFPALLLANVAPGTSTVVLGQVLSRLNRVKDSRELIDHFLGHARLSSDGKYNATRTSSALYVLTRLLSDLRSTEDAAAFGKDRLSRDVIDVSLSWLNIDDFDSLERSDLNESTMPDDMADRREESSLAVTYGATAPTIVKPSTKRRAQSDDRVIHCLCLQLLSLAARMDPQAFQTQMMHVLYPVLRSYCPTGDIQVPTLQSFANTCIHNIASSAGFVTPADLLVHNVDYILNSVSAHLRGTTVLSSGALDPLAPGVLVAVIQLAGAKILPYLGDAVDEIFDSLDRWHAYDLLVSELLRVLDSLVGISVGEAVSQAPSHAGVGRATAEIQKTGPDPQRDLDDFEAWFTGRHDDRLRYKTEVPLSNLPSQNPKRPFAGLSRGDAGAHADEEPEEDDQPMEEDKPEVSPMTKSQTLVLSILRKCMYFLPHPSPFLRARVLTLVSSCIPILADRTSDFFPEIHRFWPYILARLDDGVERTPAYVLLEVINLVLALVKYRGDFMQKRMTQDVLPKLRSLLGGYDLRKISKSRYSTEYRLLRVTMQLVTVTLAEVPGISNDDTWVMASTFRSFLSAGIDEELRGGAIDLFRTLGQLDADTVWLALSSGLGQMDELQGLRIPAWSHEEASVTALLQQLA